MSSLEHLDLEENLRHTRQDNELFKRENHINRMVVVGDGFDPTDEDLLGFEAILKERYPDREQSSYLSTSLRMPNSISSEYAGIHLEKAIKTSAWGKTVLMKYFRYDMTHNASIVFLNHEKVNGIRSVAIVSVGCILDGEDMFTEPDHFYPSSKWTKYPTLHPIGQLNLENLAHPLFLRSGIAGHGPEDYLENNIRRLVHAATVDKKGEDFLALERATRNVPVKHPDFSLGYEWRAVALTGLGRINEALELLDTGLELCTDPLRLCGALGFIYEQKQSITQFGWYMQSYFLGTDSYWPYLVLGRAALSSGLLGLSRFLLNKLDTVIFPNNILRLPSNEEARIDSLVMDYRSDVKAAFAEFSSQVDLR